MSADPATAVLADNATLFRQAPMTADYYMAHAIKDIDARLGEGYAAKHPELIAAYMQTAALDMGMGAIARAIDNIKIGREKADGYPGG